METVLLSTQNICFGSEIKDLQKKYRLGSVKYFTGLYRLHSANLTRNLLVRTLYNEHSVLAVLILLGRFEICLEPRTYLNSLPK